MIALLVRWDSDPLQDEVAVEMLHAVVPSQHQVRALDLLQTLDHDVNNVAEVPIRESDHMRYKEHTYFFPVGTNRGFRLVRFSMLKTNSTGTLEKLCGPVNSTGSCRLSNTFNVAVDV